MAYLTESLETWRLIKTDGEYSGVCCLPNTNLLVVVNSMTSSVDVITAYGLCLYSYRMPNHVCKSHGYLAVTLFNDNPVIIVSAQTGIICMNMNWSGKRGIRKPELSLRSIQRYVHPEKDRFKPEGLCAIGSHVLVADFSGSRVVKFKLMAGAAGTNRLFLYKIGEHDVLEPLALDIVPLEDGAAQIGVARLKGRAPGYHLLKFINITLGDNERRGQRGISLYSPSSSSA
ncbi:uncharacterized protein LOC135472108 [Liolophura sinensis]|uniref:uncharacterized protein LOC135472108 n=1 Tax=Liolophura sinensis TaxID=3198878 RepID=UPI003158E2FB